MTDKQSAILRVASRCIARQGVRGLRVAAAIDEVGIEGDTTDLAAILTAPVEGLSGRWLGDGVTTTDAQRLLRTGIPSIIDTAHGGSAT